MAIVVSARTPLEAQPGLAPPSAVPAERLGRLHWAMLAAVASYGLSVVGETAVRFADPGPATDTFAALLGGSALIAALALAVIAWASFRHDATLLLAATFGALIAAGRLVTNGILVSLDLPTPADIVDFGLSQLALGCLVWATAAAFMGNGRRSQATVATEELFHRVTDVALLVVFAVSLTGAAVRAVGASWACQGTFPDCNGLGALPFGRDPLADVQLYHRLLAYVALALVVWLSVEALRTQRQVGRLALALLGCTLGQAAIGIASIASLNPAVTQSLHTAGSGLTLAAGVALAVGSRRLAPRSTVSAASRTSTTVGHSSAALAGRPPTTIGETIDPSDFTTRAAASPLASPLAGSSEAVLPNSLGRVVSAYVQLTKPRVMSLLLATTATAMVIAARGMPDLGIFIATLVGGALMPGGAGAINHYADRDIDPLMGRTAWRPIPSGVISPRRALGFGIALAVLASAVFILFVNPLAWLLAVIGLLGYVFIYTLWLKRTTPSNIVIGGAAGAIPPLVGWAAVTNEIGSLTAWYLFAIIFFWTPPHFWALSLLIRQHYERAGVPMLPVVRGDEETRRQIVLYAVLLVALTLVLSPFGMMGLPYFVAAVILGALFIRGAIVLWRRRTREAARSLYLYSMLYLFALFAAMAVDRVISA